MSVRGGEGADGRAEALGVLRLDLEVGHFGRRRRLDHLAASGQGLGDHVVAGHFDGQVGQPRVGHVDAGVGGQADRLAQRSAGPADARPAVSRRLSTAVM